MDKNEKLMELFQSEEFKHEVDKMESEGRTSVEELRKLFAQNGLDLSSEEVVDLCHKIAIAYESGDELDEENLEEVAGGLGWIAIGCILLGVYGIGSAAVGVYNGWKEAAKADSKK